MGPLLPPELLFQRDAPYEPDASRGFKRASKYDCRIGEICEDQDEEEEEEDNEEEENEVEEDGKNKENLKNPSSKGRGRQRRPVYSSASRDSRRRSDRRQSDVSSSKDG